MASRLQITHHELNHGDAKVLVHHRVQPNGSLAEEFDELGEGNVDGEVDMILQAQPNVSDAPSVKRPRLQQATTHLNF